MDDKIVVAKPVPSRPTTYSNFSTFSELLAGAINTVPSNPSTRNPVSAIRPKTVRFKPTFTNAYQAETSGGVVCRSSGDMDKVLNSENKSVIYKPLAKVVSKRTFSKLADLGNSNLSHPQSLAHVESPAQPLNHIHSNYNSKTNINQQVSSSQTGQEKTTQHPNNLLSSTEDDQKNTSATANPDRVSYDGYNWRKYGQKQVKGSEYPRSYYKCTHPSCPVKKKVERTLDGQIAEIVYKGEHNHLKPQPIKRNTTCSQELVPDSNLEDKMENQNEGGIGISPHSGYLGKRVLSYDDVATCALENSCEEAGVDETKTKRKRVETEADVSGEKVEEPQVMVPNPPADSEMIGDGYRWRKYGQKVVKGNPYPRSYYRCTNPKCNVRKHVERSIDDPTSFVTTYEGRHNHEMPTKPPNPTPSESATSKDKP